MRSTITKKVSKMDMEIGKMHRELAKLYEQRAQLMQSNVKAFKTATDIDFPDEIIEELANAKPVKKAKKAK